MTVPAPLRRCALLAATLLACAALAPSAARADDRESIEILNQTTLNLIEALVQAGVLTREKADALIRQAREKAVAAVAKAREEQAKEAIPENAIRVPYVPQNVRDQIRNEVKEEVVAQARVERWGVPNATAEWTDRIRIDGDLRLRGQRDDYAKSNPAPDEFLVQSLAGVTRAADFAAGTSLGLATANTQEDRQRLRVRARLGLTARVTDQVTAGVRLATGAATDRVSTNQTLGNNFNKYTLSVDRAYVQLDPAEWLTVSGGRIPNPWFSTDLAWSDNLNFEGVAATLKRPARQWQTVAPFLTLGYFPVRESAPPRSGRALFGAQLGVQWELTEAARLKFGVAQYRYSNLEGRVDPDYDAVLGAGRSYGQYEYEAGLRQRGNTLFLTNNPFELQSGLTPDRARWGLASRFKPLALTAAAELGFFAPYYVLLSGEYVRNKGFNRAEILDRTGITLVDGRNTGYQFRTVVGAQRIANAGDWQVSLAYRWIGSDAVLDAFTDSDFGLGGTNLKGLVFGLEYAPYRNSSVALRYLSAKTIDSPTVQPAAGDRFGVDVLQLDLNVRF